MRKSEPSWASRSRNSAGGRWLRLAAATVAVALFGAILTGGGQPPGGATSLPADPPVAGQRAICFPPAEGAKPKTFAAGGIVIWSDAPVNGRELVAHLQKVRRHLRSAVAATQPATASMPADNGRRPVALAVYRTRRDYLRLWKRVGAHYRGRFGAIAAEGYSYRVFCATSYDSPEEFAKRRPVICHEFAHVWLYQTHGLRNDGNWLTEALANAAQLHFFPDSGDRADFLRWMDAGKMIPLKRLMNMPRIASSNYWQAATLGELLLLRHRDKLPAVIRAFNRGDSAYAIVTKVLKTDLATFERQWADHVRRSARAATTRPR